MKSVLLFLIVGVFSVLTTQAQITEQNFLEQERKIQEIETQIQNLQSDLQKFNKRYRTGSAFLIGGLTVSTIGYLGANIRDIEMEKNTHRALSITGALLSFTGLYFQIDAHKFLGGRGSTFIGDGRAGFRFRM